MEPANQQYVDAAALQAEGMHGIDAAAIAAAAQQLEAIHAALQQAGTTLTNPDQMTAAALEHLHAAKPEDYLAHLAVVNAVAASAAETAGGHHHQDLQGDMDGHDGGGGAGDKPLTSRYRGVCWNKKNRRWQAAINSSGKYIYLGSFVQEEEAARAFDKAAVRLRGNRAKLNYSLSDYVDDAGNLVDDPRLSAHLQNVLGKEGGKGPKGSGVDAPEVHGGLLTAAVQQNMLYSQNLAQVSLAQHILSQSKSQHYPYSNYQKHAYGVVDVPDGCSLISHIPGDEEAFAVLYFGPHVPHGGAGAAVWDGNGAIDLGIFDTEKDARNAAGAALKLAMFHRHTLAAALSANNEQNTAQQQASAAAAAAAAQYGLLLGGQEAAGGDNDAAAMAAAAAAAAAGSDPNALAQQLGLVANLNNLGQGLAPEHQNQYKDLFSWLASAARAGKADEGGPVDNGVASTNGVHHQHTEAEVAGAEAMAAMMMSAVGGLKNVRDVDNGDHVDDGAVKRSRVDDGMAQMKQLSGFKLQDVMKSLFDPNQAQQ